MSWSHKRAKIDAEADRDGICAIGTRLGAEVFGNAAEAQKSLAQVETDCQSIKAFRRSRHSADQVSAAWSVPATPPQSTRGPPRHA